LPWRSQSRLAPSIAPMRTARTRSTKQRADIKRSDTLERHNISDYGAMEHELDKELRSEALVRAQAQLKRLARRALQLLGKRSAEQSYWERRKNFRCILYVQELVRILEPDAKSAIDIEARDTCSAQ
jgi:hypothetical protein